MAKTKEEKVVPYKHDVSGCIEKIIKRAKKNDPSINYIEFECSIIKRLFGTSNKTKTGQPIVISRKSKTGKEIRKKSYVAHSFCPFCGKEF